MTKEWYRNNRSYALNYKRMARVDNIEKVTEQERRSHIKNKEKRNAYCLNYYYTHRDEMLARHKARYQEKKEEIKAKNRARRERQKLEKKNAN